MNLTARERLLIARRAGGEYGVIPQIRKIAALQKKGEREDTDAIFFDFARLVLQKSWSMDEYLRLQKAVLTEIPEPRGEPFWKKPQPAPEVEPAGTVALPKKKKRVITCGICEGVGHNARTCPAKPNTPTVTHTDGAERLTPGFDPNPPEVEDSSD